VKAMNRHETCPIMKSTEYQRYYRANIVTESWHLAFPPVWATNLCGGGEGRAQTEKNIDQSHMSPTQSGTRMSPG
jgi:hypothetical protein